MNTKTVVIASCKMKSCKGSTIVVMAVKLFATSFAPEIV